MTEESVDRSASKEWRVGSHYGIHVYEGDRPVATFQTVADAKLAVEAVNAMRWARQTVTNQRIDRR